MFPFMQSRSMGAAVEAVAPFSWNPADISPAELILSNNNKTAASPSNASDYSTARATNQIGSSIAQAKIDSAQSTVAFGLSLLSTPIAQGGALFRPGTYLCTNRGYIYKNGNELPNGPQITVAVGSILGVSFNGSDIKFYKDGILAYTVSRTTGETGSLYPTFDGYRGQVTLTP